MYSKELAEANSRVMDRRRFLRLGGIGIAGAALVRAMGSGNVLAQEPPSGSSLVEEFEAAAREYGVPVGLLLAMGYVPWATSIPAGRCLLPKPAATSPEASTDGAATGSCTSSATLPRTLWARLQS